MTFIFPTPRVGAELYAQVGFLFGQFLAIDVFIVEKCEWYHKKALDFVEFRFFEELSRYKVLWEHVIVGMILFTFSVIFVKL